MHTFRFFKKGGELNSLAQFLGGAVIGGLLISGAMVLGSDTNKDLPACRKGFSCAYGLLYSDPNESFQGYTLINPRRGDKIYLVNWQGKLVHQWKLPDLPPQAEILNEGGRLTTGSLGSKLLPSGNLLLAYGEPGPNGYWAPVTGAFNKLVELDWEGNVVWKYENTTMHHGFERLPDGRTAITVWEKIPNELADRIRGGISGTGHGNGGKDVYADAIIEIDRGGNAVWRWSVKDHLDPAAPENALDPESTRNTWTHLDAIEYVENNPINGKPSYLISLNFLDTLAFVERESGKIIWRWGDDFLGGQHSVSLTDRGSVVTFNNGKYREHYKISRKITPWRYTIPISEVVEVGIEPTVLRGAFSPGPLQPVRGVFHTTINGSVQALPNGNILVSAGTRGRVFELDMLKQKVVWDYINPFGPIAVEWPTVIENSVFSAFRYAPDYTEKFRGLKLK